MHEWFEKGAYVVGVGDSLVGPAKENKYDQVKSNAQAFHQEFLSIAKKNKLIPYFFNIYSNEYPRFQSWIFFY